MNLYSGSIKMQISRALFLVSVILVLIRCDYVAAKPVNSQKHIPNYSDENPLTFKQTKNQQFIRLRRQLDFDIGAEHEEGIGTDLTTLISANLYKSNDGRTRIDGTAKYSQYFSETTGPGKSKIGGSLHLSHSY